MNRNGLAKLYDQFTPEERFKLDVEAMARGDAEESERLTRTCPRYTYEMNELGFTARWHASLEITAMVCLEMDKHLARLQMLEVFRPTFPSLKTIMENSGLEAYYTGHERGARFAWEKAGKEGDPPGYGPDDELHEREADSDTDAEADDVVMRAEAMEEAVKRQLDTLEWELARIGYSAWSAYLTFCEEDMGVEPHKMLIAYSPHVAHRGSEMDALAQRLELEVDPEIAEGCLEAVRGLWRKHLDRGE
jgi:hypothetical protein